MTPMPDSHIHSPIVLTNYERTRSVKGVRVKQTVTDATTACGIKIEGAIGSTTLSIGLSAWSSDLTCPACRERIGLLAEEPPSPPTTPVPPSPAVRLSDARPSPSSTADEPPLILSARIDKPSLPLPAPTDVPRSRRLPHPIPVRLDTD